MLGKDKASTQFRGVVTQLRDLLKTIDCLLGKVAQQDKNAIIPRIQSQLGLLPNFGEVVIC